ncbi:hypothetical protein KL920_003128 [Ogataea angusta]|nr:hypothetical protein KL920_003128 [Ogataea angusta]
MPTVFDEVSKHTLISIDTMSQEDKEFLMRKYNIEFLNATSNQVICFVNWQHHQEVVYEAIKLVNKKFGDSVPKSASAANFKEYIQEIKYYGTAISGRNQLKGLKGCVLSQITPEHLYDEEATYSGVKKLIEAYEDIGVDRSKVIVKLGTSYETMQAAKRLFNEDKIQILGTMIHSLEQAILAAEADCVAISPYVDDLSYNVDPSSYKDEPLDKHYGYNLAVAIHKYYRAYQIKTVNCVAAQIGITPTLALAGVDEMTLPPPTLNKILNSPLPADYKGPVLKQTYTPEEAGAELSFINDKEKFYSLLNSNATALKRINGARDVFVTFDAKASQLIETVLSELKLI